MPDVFGKTLSGSRSLYVDDVTIGTVSITQNYSTVPYKLQLPPTQGIPNSFLTNNGSGLLTWRDETTLPYIEEVGISVPSFLTVTNSPIIPTSLSPTLGITYSGDPLPILYGGTGTSESTGTEKVVLWRSPTFADNITVPVIRGGGSDGSLEITTLQPGGILSLQSSNAVGLSAPAIFLGESRFPTVKGDFNTFLKTINTNGATAWRTIDLAEIIGGYGAPGSLLSSTGTGVAWTTPALTGVMSYKQIFFEYDEEPVPPEVQIWRANGNIDFRTMFPVEGAQYGLALTYTSEFGEFKNNYDFPVVAEISYSFARHVAFGIPLFSAPETIDFNTQIDSLLAITATILNGQSLFWVEVNDNGKPLAAAGAPGGGICCASTTVILQPGDFFQFRGNNKASAEARIGNECEATINLMSAGPTTGYAPPSPGTGSVTSVNLTTSNPFLVTGGGPITTNGTLNIGLSGEALPTANGGTGVTTSTGTGSNVLSTAPTFTGATINSGLTLGTALSTGNGGTGITTVGTSGQVLTSNGTTLSWTTPSPPGTGTVTSVSASAPLASSGGVTPTISFTGTLPVANGGTGVTASTGTGSNVLSTAPTFTGATINSGLTLGTALSTGNGGTGITTVGTSGQVLTSNGTTLSWTTPSPPGTGTVTSVSASAPLASSGGVTPTISFTGTLPVANGGTGVTTSTGTGAVVLNSNPSFGVINTPYIEGSDSFGDIKINSTRYIFLDADNATVIGSNNYPNGTGLAGQVLYTNGGGTLFWATPPGGGVGGGTVTSVGLTSSNAFITVGGPSPITSAGVYTLGIGTLPVANGGTGTNSSTGTGAVVLNLNPTFSTLNTSSIVGADGPFNDLYLDSDRLIFLRAATAVVIGSNTYPNSTGTNGQVLTTNGGGTLSWRTPPVTSVSASSPLASSGGSSPTISIVSSTGTGSVVLATSPTISGATLTGDVYIKNRIRGDTVSGDLALSAPRDTTIEAIRTINMTAGTATGEGLYLNTRRLDSTQGAMYTGSDGSTIRPGLEFTYKPTTLLSQSSNFTSKLSYDSATGHWTNTSASESLLITASYSFQATPIPDSAGVTYFFIRVNGVIDTAQNLVTLKDNSSGTASFFLGPGTYFSFFMRLVGGNDSRFNTGSNVSILWRYA